MPCRKTSYTTFPYIFLAFFAVGSIFFVFRRGATQACRDTFARRRRTDGANGGAGAGVMMS